MNRTINVLRDQKKKILMTAAKTSPKALADLENNPNAGGGGGNGGRGKKNKKKNKGNRVAMTAAEEEAEKKRVADQQSGAELDNELKELKTTWDSEKKALIERKEAASASCAEIQTQIKAKKESK